MGVLFSEPGLQRELGIDLPAGRVAGASFVQAFGERESMNTGAAGEDIWRGTAVAQPMPADAGEQMTVVSTNAGDASAGTGVQTARIHYLDATGVEQDEDVILDGTTEVDTAATNIRFVNKFHALTVGANGVADGQITLYKKGASATVYSLIDTGGNMSMVPSRMVPFGKKLYVRGWQVTEAQGRRVNVRLRSTSEDGDLHAGVFLFKDLAYLNGTTSGWLPIAFEAPALSVVKVTGWVDAVGAECGCRWEGILIPDGLLDQHGSGINRG